MGKNWYGKDKKPEAPAVDPVEAAKVIAAPVVDATQTPYKPSTAPAAPKMDSTPIPVATTVPTTAYGVGARKKARVKVEKVVSLRGQIVTLTVGTIVTEDSYGPGIFEKLSNAKVELEPMD
jgi:hypothetical protein